MKLFYLFTTWLVVPGNKCGLAARNGPGKRLFNNAGMRRALKMCGDTERLREEEGKSGRRRKDHIGARCDGAEDSAFPFCHENIYFFFYVKI